MSDATDPWSGWHAETVERGSKALNERDAARPWVVALEQRLAEVRALHSVSPGVYGGYCGYCEEDWPCCTAALLDAPLEPTE